MILLCAGERSDRTFDALLLWAAQLSDAGFRVGIDDRFLPDDIPKYQKYDAALNLCDAREEIPETVLLIGAERISSKVQLLLRSFGDIDDLDVKGIGRFTSHQDLITAQNKLAYALSREADVVNLSDDQSEMALIGETALPLVAQLPRARDESAQGRLGLLVYLPHDVLELDGVLPALSVLSHSIKFNLRVITNGQGKDLIRKSRFANLVVFGNSELPPSALVSFADVVAFFGESIPGPRMAQLALEAMSRGKAVIDGLETQRFLAKGAPVLKGPTDPVALTNYLEATVLPQLTEISRRIQSSNWLRRFDLDRLIARLGLVAASTQAKRKKRMQLFLPTNGSGLGHAQRCALIAEALPEDSDIGFAAFPSCIDLLRGRGFDCLPLVQKSSDLVEDYANDLVNYRRLNGLLQAGDHLIFDGGYVFDSIYRVIASRPCSSTWIRRGLWRANQIHARAIEREHIFDNIIVPRECFEELNMAYSFGECINEVGPIVKSAQGVTDRIALRETLSAHLDHPFDTLVVTMLGGGVASDRTAQTQAVCELLERRPNCLHLVVAWPNAVVAAGFYGWANTRVIETQDTLGLCQLADLVVSAAGYNSFHELIYAGLPSVFVPQSAPYLDDQERRATAAADRGLAAIVPEADLMTLRRTVLECIDNGLANDFRNALSTVDLPKLGNRDAAGVIARKVDP